MKNLNIFKTLMWVMIPFAMGVAFFTQTKGKLDLRLFAAHCEWCVSCEGCDSVPFPGSQNCGTSCDYTCTPSCACAVNYCVGTTCWNGCNGYCGGTKVVGCGSIVCTAGSKKCDEVNNQDLLQCNTEGTGWNWAQDCVYGCTNGACNAAPTLPYCENTCNSCTSGDPPQTHNNEVHCWATPAKLGAYTTSCIDNTSCVPNACHPASETCGGTIDAYCNSLDPPKVSHVDNCGGQNCGDPCTPPPGGTSCGDGACTGAETCSNCPEDCVCCIEGYPEPPTLATPGVGETVAAGVIPFSWTLNAWNECPSCGGTRAIKLCVGTDSANPCNGGSVYNLAGSATSYNGYSQTNFGTYWWSVEATNTCGHVSGFDKRSFRVNRTPEIPVTPYAGVTLRNSPANTLVNTEAFVNGGTNYNGNQICDTVFNSNNTVRFIVQGIDGDGAADINEIHLRMGANTASITNIFGGGTRAISGAGWAWEGVGATASATGVNTMTASFPIVFNSAYAPGIREIEIRIVDRRGGTTGWVATGRRFKWWDCKVAVSGDVYDGSVGQNCSTGLGYSDFGTDDMNFTSLLYNGAGTPDQNMNVTMPHSYATALDHTNELLWGKIYVPQVNSDIEGTNQDMRIVDTGDSSTNPRRCNQVQVNLDNATVNPYSNTPRMDIDLSFIQDQDPWFQVVDGGIKSQTQIANGVPITCSNDYNDTPMGICRPAMSIGTTDGAGSFTSFSGLVSAPTMSISSSCNMFGNNCFFGQPDNWNYPQNIVRERQNFDYYYTEFYEKLKIGKAYSTTTSMSTIKNDTGGLGVVFVDGDLAVDVDNSLDAASNQYLLVFVSGSVVFADTVNNSAGIFSAGANIMANGESATQLQIQGSLHTTGGQVQLGRGFVDHTDNNIRPGVVVRYRPDFIFSLPPNLVEGLSDFRDGN